LWLWWMVMWASAVVVVVVLAVVFASCLPVSVLLSSSRLLVFHLP
jgi:hypothetical protein